MRIGMCIRLLRNKLLNFLIQRMTYNLNQLALLIQYDIVLIVEISLVVYRFRLPMQSRNYTIAC